MVTTRKRLHAADVPASPKRRIVKEEQPTPAPSPPTAFAADEYQKLREQRIRENQERMQKLGIVDLSHQLTKSHQQLASARRASAPRSPSIPDNTPTRRSSRRSSRLQSVTPVSYSEVDDVGERKKRGSLVVEGEREEVYTDEHEKLLGSCENSWELFVDGCGPDGKRVYDSVSGKTCHQCRQKTLGHRTQCSNCKIVQGQFCGDCLYMRYGENVLEVENNPNWICPPCRGICNCSICRVKKGWAPTGVLYKKITSLGFKSVAHYLIQSRRGQTTESGEQSAARISSKKSLPFADSEEPPNPENSSFSEENSLVGPGDQNTAEKDLPKSENPLPETGSNQVVPGDEKSSECNMSRISDAENPLPETGSNLVVTGDEKSSECNMSRISDAEFVQTVIAALKLKDESTPDSIGARLRNRRNKA